MLFPFMYFLFDSGKNEFDYKFWLSILWLAIPVSIFAVLLWLWLLKADAVQAGLWLFLCPVFGFMVAALIINDSITTFTVVGVFLVTTGLFLSQSNIWAR